MSDRAKTLELPHLRRAGTGPLHLLVDSTGLKLGGAGEWLVEKHGASRRRSWRKSHIGVDAVSGEIVAIAVTRKDIDDAAMADALLDQIADPIASFTADGGYHRVKPGGVRSGSGHPGCCRASSGCCRHRAATGGRGGECVGRNRSDTARPPSADDHRSRPHGLAKS
jgi:hypothetical protein